MTYQTIPLFSVPLHKTNIGVMDPIEKTWAKNLHFPPQESSKIRWSLAFNCFVRGKLGVGTKQLEL